MAPICSTAHALEVSQKALFGEQVREDCPGPLVAWYRHISKGAWPFSTRDHGWPISDCSSEGLKVIPFHLLTPVCALAAPCTHRSSILRHQPQFRQRAAWDMCRAWQGPCL